jgi:hypothetical protein
MTTGKILSLFGDEPAAPAAPKLETFPWPASGVYALALAGRVDLALPATKLTLALRDAGLPAPVAVEAMAQLAALGLCSAPRELVERAGAVERIFEAWVSAAVKSGARRFAPKLTKDRRAHIAARLRDYTEQQCLDAVRGIWADEWWRDHLERLDVEHAFSSGSRLERYAQPGQRARELDEADRRDAERETAPAMKLSIRRAT